LSSLDTRCATEYILFTLSARVHLGDSMATWEFSSPTLHLVGSGGFWHAVLAIGAWSIGAVLTAELLGYWLHRLLHTGLIAFLSRNHMNHHMVQYGPLQKQRTPQYHDATEGRIALGNIGLEWLIPGALLIAAVLFIFHFLHVRVAYQLLFIGETLVWSFLMISYLHDIMHVESIWLEKNRWLAPWFVRARRLHDIHHFGVNDRGLMDRNFGIGFYFFDRLFGTFSRQAEKFNRAGYDVAQSRFKSILQIQ